ncbi:hypothetical protein PPERSA_04548 [Pseudocohnilembus persalinus]|uniref:Uncharacterized protein n=1 Tax=Pseudocohnilembus persalinus TaxID=266149 RepID=A0A0V0QEC4_PSEPJ|nr:hypothetical protein PPERSA_04548 [Pseudocohnilembus persalinus]|eukprot:KRX00527.1 hypothetical protein PPERSA_04548 [Pseudocohnilembus persalinus]
MRKTVNLVLLVTVNKKILVILFFKKQFTSDLINQHIQGFGEETISMTQEGCSEDEEQIQKQNVQIQQKIESILYDEKQKKNVEFLYQIDQEGNLMDDQGNYIVDDNNQMIRLVKYIIDLKFKLNKKNNLKNNEQLKPEL